MFGIQHFSAFLLACIALNLTPDLDTFYILARSSREGRAIGIGAALGINAGCLVHTIAAVIGLSAILMTSALAFTLVKYLGAAYLCWIGLRMLMTRQDTRTATVTTGKGFRSAFFQGMLTNVLNPKVALFYLSFLPPFVSTHAPDAQLALLVLGLSFIGTGLAWSMVLALLGSRIQALLSSRPALGARMDKACGAVLLAFGIALTFQNRR